jgi:hypothetical protein
VRLAEMGDERRISPVRFGARQSALGVGCDARGVDQADTVARLIEEQRQRHPVLSCGFQARMDLRYPVLAHPTGERSVPRGIHGERVSGQLFWLE